jgi:NAD(P)-dependent dehydrogenase (short-subunit alcohol dehydrogenase family)
MFCRFVFPFVGRFANSLAQNLVDKKIRVNCVAPSPVWTPLNIAGKPPQKAAEHERKHPWSVLPWKKLRPLLYSLLLRRIPVTLLVKCCWMEKPLRPE